MSAKDWFGVVVRTIGLIVTLNGLHYLLGWAFVILGISGPANQSLTGSNFFYGLGAILVGFYLMRGADRITQSLYPE